MNRSLTTYKCLILFFTSFCFFVLSFIVPKLLAIFSDPLTAMQGLGFALVGSSVGGALRSTFGERVRWIAMWGFPLNLAALICFVSFTPFLSLYYLAYFFSLISIGWIIADGFAKGTIVIANILNMLGAFFALLVLLVLPAFGAELYYLVCLFLALIVTSLHCCDVKKDIQATVLFCTAGILLCTVVFKMEKLNLLLIAYDMSNPKNRAANPSNNGFKILKNGARLIDSRVSFFSRIDVIDSREDNLPLYYNNHKFTSIIEETGQIGSHVRLEGMKSALVIGVGGGRDISSLFNLGFQSIDAVELNTDTVNIMTQNLEVKKRSRDVYSLANVINGEGRSYLMKNKTKKYDYISLNYTDTNYVMNSPLLYAENFLLTRESFKRMFESLNDDGLLLIALKIQFADSLDILLLRTLNTAREVLGDHVEDHFFCFYETRQENIKAEGTVYCDIKKSSFDAKTSELLRNTFVEQKNMCEVYPKSSCADYESVNARIHALLTRSKTFDEEVRSAGFKMDPTTDNSPYMYILEPKELLNKSRFFFDFFFGKSCNLYFHFFRIWSEIRRSP